MIRNQRTQNLLPKFGLVFLLLIQMLAYGAPMPASAASDPAPRAERGTKTWNVPGDFDSIQPALDAVGYGDTILVGPGTYTGSLDFKGKHVILQSQTGPGSTAITGDNATTVTIGPNGWIIGFTISNAISGNKGGIHVFGIGTLIKNNFIENNNNGAYLDGAAIYGNSASPYIEGNIIRNNFCQDPYDDGAVSFVNNSTGLTIENNIFENNSCAAIKFDIPQGNIAFIFNNTIVSNNGGIYVDAHVPQNWQIYRNNILYQNNIGLKVSDGDVVENLPEWENNLVFGNDTDYVGIANPTGTNGNISVDPILNPASQPPYMLLPGSPVVDGGNSNGCPSFDFHGVARPRGAGCDIGAYESYDNLVTSIVREDPALISTSIVHFMITFLRPVTGVDLQAPFSDFAVKSFDIADAAVTGVTGSGDIYHVTVDTGSGSGQLGLEVVDDDSILDSYSLPLGGVGAGNGNFTGEYYTIDKTSPTVVSSVRAGPNSPQGSSASFLVTFSEPVTGVDTADFKLTTTSSISNASINSVSPYYLYNNMYTVMVGTGNGIGTIRLDIPASATITDLAGLPLANLPYQDGASYTVSSYHLYMPLTIHAKMANIFGYVAANYSAMHQLPVKLRFYNGSSWSTLAIVSTENDGFYGFDGVASLKTGQKYAVCFNNVDTPGALLAWCTKSLVAYTAGDIVNIGNFDIGSINIVAPPYYSNRVSLPYTFQWTPRPFTPTDSYEFDLYDYKDGAPYYYTPKLGYVGEYTLKKLPSGFKTNTKYVWAIWVYSPDGGYGFEIANFVGFSNKGSSALDPGMPTWLPDNLGHDRENLPGR